MMSILKKKNNTGNRPRHELVNENETNQLLVRYEFDGGRERGGVHGRLVSVQMWRHVRGIFFVLLLVGLELPFVFIALVSAVHAD